MGKYIHFKVNDGRIYEVPVMAIAEDRANHYVEKDPDTTFADEVNFVLEDDYEAIDWYRNNMNPEDILHKVKLIKEASPVPFEDLDSDDYEIEIVEKDRGSE